MRTKKNTATVETATVETATVETATVETATVETATVEPCINASFDTLSWTSALYETVSKKQSDTMSARAKGYKTQGLVSQLLLQPVEVVLETLTDAIMHLPAGTETRTIVIRKNVAASDPVPKSCKYVDGEWLTDQSTNVRQVHKVAVKSAFTTLSKRDADIKDSYSLPGAWKTKSLEWQAAPGDKQAGFFAIVDRKAKKEEPIAEITPVKELSVPAMIYTTMRKVMSRQQAAPIILSFMAEHKAYILAGIKERQVERKLAADKANAYSIAMERTKIIEQMKAFESAGFTAETIDLAMTREHGTEWKVIGKIA